MDPKLYRRACILAYGGAAALFLTAMLLSSGL